jgi:(p)ppGpp synthase/HD superfamily hydrolase
MQCPMCKTKRVIDDIRIILDAANFAAKKHANQKRKGAAGEPYINHLLEVAQLISSAISEPDAILIVAALLHDTIEDAGVTRDEIASRFGADAADLVVEVTDDKRLPKADRKRLQIQNAPKKSERGQAIKLADKISNLRSILSSPPADWDRERKRQYFQWATEVIDGLSRPNPALKAEFDRTVKRVNEL